MVIVMKLPLYPEITSWYPGQQTSPPILENGFFIPSELTIGASEVTFYLHRDDGALVYVNGSEKIRSNMPKGTIKSNTLAISPMEGYVGPLSEKTLYKMSWSASGFQAGWNEIAVEIHQCSTQERDMSFSLRVAATQTININQ